MLISKKKELGEISFEIKQNINLLRPFDSVIIDFLNKIYLDLNKIKFTKETSGLAALSFWLRNQNINKLSEDYKKFIINRMPIGIVFHITPSNTPLNFFYSYLFGIITGNINIVRVPSKNFFELNIILKIIENILKIKKFKQIKLKTYFVRYDKDSNFTKIFSSFCDLRLIWGGDETINKIRKIPIPAKSREITFSDKYSCCIINSEKILKLNKNEILRVIQNFYNDGFFFDQNACSSPHIIFWLGKNVKAARNIFWEELEIYTRSKYDLPAIGSVDKFTQYCHDLQNFKIKNIINLNNFSYNFFLENLPQEIDSLRGKWGYFYEYDLKKINYLNKFITSKFQTVTYYGFQYKTILKNVINNTSNGVDRIVPLGSAHSMNHYWDGYDMIISLTRVINAY